MAHFRLARNILLTGFLVNVLYCLIAAFVFEAPYPHTTFLFRPYDRYADFYAVMRSTVDLDPYEIRPVVNVPGHGGNEVSNYFPFTHLLFYPLTYLNYEEALPIFLFVPMIFFTFAYGAIARKAGSSWIETICSWPVFVLFCYPILFTYDRGNIDAWTFSFVAIGVYLYTRRKFHGSAFWISLAGCIKLFPLLYLYPLIVGKRTGPVLFAILTVTSITLASMFFFDGTIASNFEAMIAAMFNFSEFLLLGVNGVTHSVGLFSAGLAVATFAAQEYLPAEEIGFVLGWYNRVGFLFLLGVLAWLWRVRLEDWKRWAVLVCVFQVLPYPSYDYRLLYTLIPLTFVILDPAIPRKYVWLLCLILVPKVVPLYNDVRVSVLINPLLILTLLVMIVRDGAAPTPAKKPARKKMK